MDAVLALALPQIFQKTPYNNSIILNLLQVIHRPPRLGLTGILDNLRAENELTIAIPACNLGEIFILDIVAAVNRVDFLALLIHKLLSISPE